MERVNKTLQDRLIKEMRLQNICSIAQANQWIENFMSDFNRWCSRPAKYPKDLRRPVIQCPQELDDIFAWQELRTLSKALTFQYDKIMYIVEPTEENTRIFQAFREVFRCLLEDDQFLCLLCQLLLQAGIFSGQFTFTLRRGHLLLPFAAPRIELRFIQAEFTDCGSNTDAFSKFQGFSAKFRRMLFTCFLLVDTVLSCEPPLTESSLT